MAIVVNLSKWANDYDINNLSNDQSLKWRPHDLTAWCFYPDRDLR